MTIKDQLLSVIARVRTADGTIEDIVFTADAMSRWEVHTSRDRHEVLLIEREPADARRFLPGRAHVVIAFDTP